MSESVLLLNPRRRRRGMPAGLKRYWASRRRRRLENPRRHRRARASSSRRSRRRLYVMSNPRRHRRVHARRHHSRHRYRHLSNPRQISTRNLMGEYVMPAAIGAVGAVGLKIGWGYLAPHLPSAVQSGYGAIGAQAAVVLAAGFGLGKALPKHRRGIALGVVGALTVLAYNVAVQLLSQYAPNLAGISDYTAYPLGAYMAPTAGPLPAPAAVPAPVRRLGWVSPAPALRGLNAYMSYGPGY